MKRSDALVQLSRDHHHGLVVAQRLKRATETTTVAARDGFLTYWSHEGHDHFRIEEDVLLPAFARHHPPTDDAVARVLTHHVDLRRRAADLTTAPHTTPADLHELGDRLAAHIRHEERVLFPSSKPRCPRTNSSPSRQPSRTHTARAPDYRAGSIVSERTLLGPTRRELIDQRSRVESRRDETRREDHAFARNGHSSRHQLTLAADEVQALGAGAA